MRERACACAYVRVRMRMCVCVCVCVYVHVRVPLSHTHARMHVCARARVCVCECARAHVCVYLSRRAGRGTFLAAIRRPFLEIENGDPRRHHVAVRIDDDGAVGQEVEGELTEGFFFVVLEDREDVDLHVAVLVELGFFQDLRYVSVRRVGAVRTHE